MLVLTAFIWGTAFVSQSEGMEYVGPFTFLASRSYIGGFALIPCIFILNKLKSNDEKSDSSYKFKTLFIGGACCGIALFVASAFQQIGILYTSVGKAGFLTALYIIIVPVLGLFFGKKVSSKVWLSVFIAVVGMYLLCIKEEFKIEYGDILVIICALFFSGHILIIDYFSPKVDCVKMSCIQFFTCAVVSTIFMFIFENPGIDTILNALPYILYAGVLSSGVAYTLQIIGQKGNDPTVTSLILSLESVFALLSGVVVLGERFSLKEGFGCFLIFAAIIITQLPQKQKSLK
ncbi:MAG: DMT family transporter [Ruminococcaceae bacterium]|nr:DMT family transporter [Oscillospiraceae bacterium]